MARYLAGVLTVIAVGVLLVAYGLLSPRALADSEVYTGRPLVAAAPAPVAEFAPRAVYASRAIDTEVAPAPRRTVVTRPVSYRTGPAEAGHYVPARATVSRPRRDWTKTAMVIGGSTAAGAGLGALIGGKKGALIGAALGGGAGTVYEVKKR